MTLWYPDSCKCILHVENGELLVKCDGHNTYQDVLSHNQGLNLKYGNMQIPQEFKDQMLSYESDRDAAIRLNRQDVIQTLDRIDEITEDKRVAKGQSTLSPSEIQKRNKLREFLANPRRDRKIEPTRSKLEE
jgi:hypothetical protein